MEEKRFFFDIKAFKIRFLLKHFSSPALYIIHEHPQHKLNKKILYSMWLFITIIHIYWFLSFLQKKYTQKIWQKKKKQHSLHNFDVYLIRKFRAKNFLWLNVSFICRFVEEVRGVSGRKFLIFLWMDYFDLPEKIIGLEIKWFASVVGFSGKLESVEL